MSGLTGHGAFAGLSKATHDVIEDLLSLIWRACEWTDDHEDLLEEWRATRGEDAKADWRWWIGAVDDDLYALDFDTREAAVAAGLKEYAPEGKFRLVEARLWADLVKEGEDACWFAEQRNGETIAIAGNDR